MKLFLCGLFSIASVAFASQCNTTTEYLEKCGLRCEPKCKSALLLYPPCPDTCDAPACHCKFGLFRHNGKCLTVKECPMNNFQCRDNEQPNACGNLCEPTCREVLRNQTKPCPKICKEPKCVCKEGYARQGYIPNDKCVLKSACQR